MITDAQRELLRRVVDLTWARARGDGSVPSRKEADEIIAVAEPAMAAGTKKES